MTASGPRPRQSFAGVAAAVLGLMLAGSALAQTLAGPALVEALRGGGHVLVMRHAASPKTLPTSDQAAAGNAKLERQLDEKGKRSAAAMGASFSALKVPVGDVWSSPTFRAMETAKLAGFPGAKSTPELGEGGANMQPPGDGAQNWLKTKSAERPAAGSNRLFITHAPNINAAFGQAAQGVGDG